MAGWARRFGNWASGQVSPFGGPARPDGDSNTVSDSDFSYITDEDIKRQQQQSGHHAHHHPDPNRPSRDTDILSVRFRNKSHQIHFAPYAISDGKLSVGEAREKIAHRLEIGDARRIRLLWKGRNLKDDSARLSDEGMRSEDNIEIMCVVGDQALNNQGEPEESGSDESGEEVDSGAGDADGKPKKKKRNRNKKKKGRKSGADSDAPAGLGYTTAGAGAEHLPMPSGLHPAHRDTSNSSTPGRGPSPQPQTAMAKLQAIEDKYRAEMVPGAEAFLANPPADPAKRQFEHKKYAETILAQVLLKLDGVEVEGDADARAKRKALVKETQAFLNRLDSVGGSQS